jgi:hypothetical protein
MGHKHGKYAKPAPPPARPPPASSVQVKPQFGPLVNSSDKAAAAGGKSDDGGEIGLLPLKPARFSEW